MVRFRAVVAVAAFWNAVSLAMLLLGPETRGNDLNRVDSAPLLAGEATA